MMNKSKIEKQKLVQLPSTQVLPNPMLAAGHSI
jgi:hypothetical protein